MSSSLSLRLFAPKDTSGLSLQALWGKEQVNEVYQWSVQLTAHSSSVSFSAWLGQSFCIALDEGGKTRYFSGIISEVQKPLLNPSSEKEEGGGGIFILVPRLFFLKQGKEFCIFQNQSAHDIILKILKKNGVSHIEDQTRQCGRMIRETCVQYGESPYDFVTRLMQEEGIFFFFQHTQKGEILVLCEDSCRLQSSQATLLPHHEEGSIFMDSLTTLTVHQKPPLAHQVQLRDYAFDRSPPQIQSQAEGKGTPFSAHYSFYPGGICPSAAQEKKAAHLLEFFEGSVSHLQGKSHVATLCPMGLCSFPSSLVASSHGTIKKHAYLVLEVHHQIQMAPPENSFPSNSHRPEGWVYQNTFMAMDQAIPYRPFRTVNKPLIGGSQTAIVIGKWGEEIWCDEYGRIQVRFHWEPPSASKENTSTAWVRVAQMWAGAGWGSVWTPRIGMEVVVTFLNGDPDHPLVTGCVYNGQHRPPYVKDSPTKSTLKSHTEKGEGGNEIRFDDKKEAEELFFHAQKDLNTVIKNQRTTTIEEGDDETHLLQGSRHVTLHGEKKNDQKKSEGMDTLVLNKGSRLIHLKGSEKAVKHALHIDQGDQEIVLKKGHASTILEEGNFSLELKKGKAIFHIQGDRQTTLKGKDESTHQGDVHQTVSGHYELTVKGNLTLKVSGALRIEGDQNVTLSSGGTLALRAKQGISLQAERGNISLQSTGSTQIKATGAFQAEGVSARIKGNTTTEVEGGVSTTVKAGATLGLKGALIQIG